MSALKPDEISTGAELDVAFHARLFACEMAKTPMCERDVVRRAHQPDGEVGVSALSFEPLQINDERLRCFHS